MYSTTFRKVGGSLMLSVPPVLIEILNIKPAWIGALSRIDDTLNGLAGTCIKP